jgi:bifunctional DNA-binding transcriptional regulator/antitoxin component of YhaV-PrlF toxin-antitoxin module
MRVQSQVSRKHKGKEYMKFWVVISNKTIEKLGWKSGDELDQTVKNGKLILKKEGAKED